MITNVYSELARYGDHVRRISGDETKAALCHRSQEILAHLCKNYLPSWGGFDAIPYIDTDKTSGQRLVIYGSFRALDKNGYYDGRADFTVTVKPHLCQGFTLAVKGRNGGGSLLRKHNLIEYIEDSYYRDLGKTLGNMASIYADL